MIHAADLFCQTMAPKAREVFLESKERLAREPWTEGPLLLSANRRLRKALKIPESWALKMVSSRREALRLVADGVILRSIQEGLTHVCFRDDCPGDWKSFFQNWQPQGIFLRRANETNELSKRASAWLLGWGDFDTGRLRSVPLDVGCATILDITAALGQLSLDESLWHREWANCHVIVCSFEPLLGPEAPTLICWSRETLPLANESDAWQAACLLGAAAAIEEASGVLDGVGFESARRRAAWEDRLRRFGGTVSDEAFERLPGISAVTFPGRSSAYLHGLLRQRNVWARNVLGSGSYTSYGKKYFLESSSVRIAASQKSWEDLQAISDEVCSALKRSEKFAEGLEAWPIIEAPEDPHSFQYRVMQKAYRPLYCGQLKSEYAVDGLRLVQASVRGKGLEGLLALLVDEEDGVIVDAAYQAFGPPTWIALAETVCEKLIRCSHLEAARLSSQVLEDGLTNGDWELSSIGRRMLNLWLESIEGCVRKCTDIECFNPPMVTPLSLEGLEPGEPYPGWEEMDGAQRSAVIEAVLDADVRPYIAMDAGGITVVAFEDPYLKISYSGSCTSCPSSIGSTLQAIQQTLRAKIHPDLVVTPEFAVQPPQSS